MDLVAEQLDSGLSGLDDVEAKLLRPRLRTVRKRTPPSGVERALGRFLQLPIELAPKRFEADYFHIADHSYAHLALLFPSQRVGVYCHDIDAFRALLPGSTHSRSRRLLAAVLLRGLRHAHVVFHSTRAVRAEILRHGLVPEQRLVQAPYGLAEEFLCAPTTEVGARPYVLHVGSTIPRKNIPLLLEVFAAARVVRPDLHLVQVGGTWSEAHRADIARRGLAPYIEQKRGISRSELAAVYAGAAVVLVPSLAEGFGLPIIESLACGAPVIASDIPVLREVGVDGVRFCPLERPESWVRAIDELVSSATRVSVETRAAIRARYSWQAHATTIWQAYARARS